MRTTLTASSLILAAGSLAAEPITIGEIQIPLGPAAFAGSVQCLDENGCGAHISYSDLRRIIPTTHGPRDSTEHTCFEVVLSDLRLVDVVQLDFAGITNQPGPDLYLAQARYVAGPLGFMDDSINDFDLRVESGDWVTIAAGAFVQDAVLPLLTVYTFESEIEASAYYLSYTLVDLSDLGIAPGAVVTRLENTWHRCPRRPSTLGLDVVTVASLNGDADGDGITDTSDNCLDAGNSDQRDTNGDGIGNVCDPDFNGDCVVNFLDLAVMRSVFYGSFADADLDGNGFVNFQDLAILRSLFFAPPGPERRPERVRAMTVRHCGDTGRISLRAPSARRSPEPAPRRPPS
jgi:hypothetical protein